MQPRCKNTPHTRIISCHAVDTIPPVSATDGSGGVVLHHEAHLQRPEQLFGQLGQLRLVVDQWEHGSLDGGDGRMEA